MASGATAAAELAWNVSDYRNSNPQKPQSGSHDNRGSSAAIYAAFMSAITGTTSLQFVRRHNALPLGSRTLFTAVEKNGYDSPMILNEEPTSVPALTTLRIQLTAVGKLVISLQTIAQPGLFHLWSPIDSSAGLSALPRGTDLWLSPNGSIARLVSNNADNPEPPSPDSLHKHGDPASAFFGAKSREWKSNVLEWLGLFGLPVYGVEREPWVQVEICVPFSTHVPGDMNRQGERIHSAAPLKRILWPARYCFRRTTSDYTTAQGSYSSPLDFAKHWCATASSMEDKILSVPSSVEERQQQQQRDQQDGLGLSLSHIEPLGEVESLSRAVEYPDFQTASSMYPTPPDAPAAVGVNSNNNISVDTFMEDLYPGATQRDNRNEQRPDQMPLSDEGAGPVGELTVGSGMYDMNDDDDLFGEMDNREFGSRGISDADFSFFDNPSFQAAESGSQCGGGQETGQDGGGSEQEAQRAVPEDTVDRVHQARSPAGIDAEKDGRGKKPVGAHTELNPTTEIVPSSYRVGRQTISPPLSPLGVKRVLFSKEHKGDDDREHGDYNPVSFKQDHSEWNQKYGAAGKFWFSDEDAPDALDLNDGGIPVIGLPDKDGKVKKGSVDSFAKANDRSGSVSSDDTDSTVEESDTSVTARSLKRKHSDSWPGDSLATLPEKPPAATTDLYSVLKTENSIFLGNFLSSFSDWSLMGYFSISSPDLSPALSQKDDQLRVAQLLVGQVTQSSLNHNLDGRISLSDFESDSFSPVTFLQEGDFIVGVERLDMRGYVALHESVADFVAAGEPVPLEASSANDIGKGSISRLDPPHLRLRRGKSYLELLPPAISFWETFGLEPAGQTKDVSAFCIHPRNTLEAVDAFLERLALLYSNCGFGEHTRGSTPEIFERGCGSWNVDLFSTSGYAPVLQTLSAMCQNLGTLKTRYFSYSHIYMTDTSKRDFARPEPTDHEKERGPIYN